MTENTEIKDNDATADDTGNDHTDSKSIWSKFKYLIIRPFIIITVYGAFTIIITFASDKLGVWGHLGGVYGVNNVLFDGIALAGMILVFRARETLQDHKKRYPMLNLN